MNKEDKSIMNDINNKLINNDDEQNNKNLEIKKDTKTDNSNKSNKNEIIESNESLNFGIGTTILSSLSKTMQEVQKSIPKINYEVLTDTIYTFNNTMQKVRESISKIDFNRLAEISNTFSKNVETPFYSWISQIDFSPLLELFKNIDFENISDVDADLAYKTFLKTMYDSRWFPYAGIIADYSIVADIFDILDCTRASKNRIKKIDKIMFYYYDKEEVNKFKRKWKNSELPSYIKRIACQAVQAYNRREYALTICALSTLWEGLIQDKSEDHGYRTSNKTRQNLKQLIEDNNYDEILSSFSNDFIFYDCHGKAEVIENVPGRHSIAHSWYNSYPTRKAALNAIIFTDFLISLS